VLDLPPIVGLADGRYLAALADVVIFVIKWNSTPLSAARSALDALQDIGKPPAGVLVNAVSENSEMLASGYYYLNRYSSYYNDAKA
jgi:Mrp family chromosome partitioning ATPase